MQVSGICGCRMNVYQDFIVFGSRFCYFFELKKYLYSFVSRDVFAGRSSAEHQTEC